MRLGEILKAFPEIRKIARLSAINSSFEQCTECPNQHNNIIKGTKRKGIRKEIKLICIWHDCVKQFKIIKINQ